jgi:hypothetical protein
VGEKTLPKYIDAIDLAAGLGIRVVLNLHDDTRY